LEEYVAQFVTHGEISSKAGLVYSDLFVAHGWYGRFLVPLGIQGAYSRLGIVLVLVFIGFPFVVRTLQPVLEGLDKDVEEAAACLGANRLQTVLRVIFPAILPAVITGFALAFARSLGEYGSVVFISGNMPFRTEIAPVLIVAVRVLRAGRYSGSYPERSVGEASPIRSFRPSIGLHSVGMRSTYGPIVAASQLYHRRGTAALHRVPPLTDCIAKAMQSRLSGLLAWIWRI